MNELFIFRTTWQKIFDLVVKHPKNFTVEEIDAIQRQLNVAGPIYSSTLKKKKKTTKTK